MFRQRIPSLTSSRRRLVLCLVAMAALAVALTASAFYYPEPTFTWEQTAGAKAALGGTCPESECVEWCRVEGDLHIPLGLYCCGPPDPYSPQCGSLGGPSYELY